MPPDRTDRTERDSTGWTVHLVSRIMFVSVGVVAFGRS